MLLVPKDFRQAFLGAVRNDALDNEIQKTLLVFVSAAEADSVCALRILQAICRSEHMYISILPVWNYAEMLSITEKEFVDKEAPRTVMLINCGSGHNIRTLLRLPTNIRITVIDSHRPIHTSYNNAEDPDTLFWHDPDDVAGPSEVPCAESTDDSDSSDSDDDANDENESPVSKRQRQQAGLPPPSVVRRKERAAQRAKRKEARLAHHAQGTYWGRPAASLLYDLAYSMQITDRRMLWWNIVGVTDQLLHQRISHEGYVSAARTLETQIATVIAEADVEEEEVGDGGGNSVMMRIPQLDRITAVDELRLVALRHWSLLESLQHSLWVAVRLATWREDGIRKLQYLLVACGLPLKQAKLAYTQMTPAVRKRAPGRLIKEAPSFGLLDFSYRSFQINNGWNQVGLSASDVVVALTALLDGGETDTRPNRDRFWDAWTALSHREVATLRKGLELAKKLQRAIVMDGGMITDRGGTLRRRHRHLHLFDLSAADIVHRVLLLRPVALLKLASFLHDAWIQKVKVAVPLVVIGPPSEEGQCLVVGFSGRPTLESQITPFGSLFELAAQQCNATKRQDLFDAAIVEIGREDAKRFGAALTQQKFSRAHAAAAAAQ